MTRSGLLATAMAVVILAAVAGCVRHGPPAPLSFPGATPTPPAPPPALAPQAHLPHPDQIVVAKGDTVYTIAQHYDLPLRSIIDANHLDPPFVLIPGTKLDLPQERFHVVRAGDTLYGVARLYGVEVSTLASLNRLSPPYGLRVGQTLYLPAPVEPAEKAPVPAAANAVAASPDRPPPPKPEQAAPVPVPAPSRAEAAETPRPASPAGNGFAWPLEGRIIESYGTGPNGTHNDGINIAATPGEPVRAAQAGVVAYAGNELRGYGNLVLIKHRGGYMTAYAHNSKLLVKRGDVVKRGQEIAKAGATGTVDSPQLHFEIREGARAVDPTSLLPSLRASANQGAAAASANRL
jgi:murein DD-endopeptidase MepM/ murein hydrolase activator NlpD